MNEDFEMEDKLGGSVNISRLSANVSLMLLSRPTPATNRYPPRSNSFSTYLFASVSRNPQNIHEHLK